jgi:glycosyltransferase involved in cell wall biosynthesis
MQGGSAALPPAQGEPKTTRVGPEPLAGAVDVSVVIPCLNEANSLGICVAKAVEAFRTAGLRGEVVVADNGSTDGSIEIAEKLGARVVAVEPRGYGAALRAGIAAARGAFIVMGDADDSYDFSEVPRFVEKWRQGFEVVMGNRFRGEIKPGAMQYRDGVCVGVRDQGGSTAGEGGGDPDHLVAGQAGSAAAFAEFSRWMAAFAVHAVVCAELVVFVAGGLVGGGGIVFGFLVAPWAEGFDAARDAGFAHHDFWRDVYVAGRADYFHRSICESL